ncbi:hypothetical protein FOT61_11380 [Serratia marcescens]|uniref:hypothetical protein n=1 Tax=Serratia marcescens TaxID=615 RepID=UPI0011C708BD|nr:hypothetical protein [Serratia marcescens]TXE41388.1 hypothetical protein FOT61_11380 [Serratia marcescens]
MEKLSELSNPVAEIVSKFGDPEAFGERKIKLLTGIQQMAYGTKFYSQEYVSALTQRIAELEAIRSDASQVFKEIGNELGCNPDNESIMMAIDALKERLATPVRLPNKNDDEFWFDNVFQVAKFDREVERAIRAAGFTVEGDE